MLVTWVALILILCLFQSVLFLRLWKGNIAEAGEEGRDQSIHEIYICVREEKKQNSQV